MNETQTDVLTTVRYRDQRGRVHVKQLAGHLDTLLFANRENAIAENHRHTPQTVLETIATTA